MVGVAKRRAYNVSSTVTRNWTWVTPDEAVASSTTCAPETVAPLDGTTISVLGDCALAICAGSALSAAPSVRAAATTTTLDGRMAHLRPSWTKGKEDDSPELRA